MSSSEKSAVSASLRPDDGSSSSTTRGLVASARAISTRRCVPVGRRSTRSSATDVSPMRSMSSSVSTPGLNFSRDQPLRISAATRTLSRTLSVLNVSSRWNVRPMPRRARWCGLIVVMSLPSSTTVPPVGGCRPGDDVEQRGLARAVGTDETGHLVLGHVDGDGGKSLETAETHRDLVDVEKRHDARTYPKTSARSSGGDPRRFSRRTRPRPRPGRRCCTRCPRRPPSTRR